MNSPGPLPVLSQLLAAVPNDRSGARSSNRFAYQNSYGLCLLLRLHSRPESYCILFDVHDDIVCLNDAIAPTSAQFFQVKTKSTGNWTAASLTKREKSKSTGEELSSFLGKLYSHRLAFGSAVDRLTFATNARFKIPLRDGSPSTERDTICLSELDSAEVDAINASLKAEHSLSSSPTGHDETHLETTPLSLSDHESHCIGVVATFLSTQGDGTIPPVPFHRTLVSEIQRRTSKEAITSEFTELVQLRGMSREQLQGMIDSVQSRTTQDDLVTLISTQLSKESFSPRDRLSIVTNVRKYLAQRLDPTNTVISDAGKQIDRELAKFSEVELRSDTILSDTLSRLSTMSIREWSAVRDLYSDTYLTAMFVVHVHEYEFSSPGSQPEEQEA